MILSQRMYLKKIKNNFLEWATVFGNYYGTSREKVQKHYKMAAVI